MREELVLLATSNSPNARVLVDKHLHGYATIQFVEKIRGGVFLAYDDEEYLLEERQWFFPAHISASTLISLAGAGTIAISGFPVLWLTSGARREFGSKNRSQLPAAKILLL